MNKTIGLLAHVDAGKTTFAEQVLFSTKSIKNRGRVDYKNSFLDNHSIEKERGITIFSEQANFEYNGSKYYLLDTPGHIDFSPEMERALKIMDYAILIISAVEGIQAYTETLWHLLRMHKIPTFIFINKIDRVGSDLEKLMFEIRKQFTVDIIYFDESLRTEGLKEQQIEFIAERDERLLEDYLNDTYTDERCVDSLRGLIKQNKLFPAFSGSALQDIGVKEFLDNLDYLTYTDYSEINEFSGRVYKVKYDERGNRISYIKATAGVLNVKDQIKVSEEDIVEKINQIRIYNGNKFITTDKAVAGEIVGVTGLTRFNAGDVIGEVGEKSTYDMVPTLKSKVIFDKTLNEKEVLSYFRILEDEDPSLNIVWDESLKEIQIHVMGTIQLEVLKKVVEERFKIAIEFGPCEILYKETIQEITVGYGHFEPLKHYAEVHIKLEPGDRNQGIKFENLCHADDLTVGHQNLIKTHVFEKDHKGILVGAPITDIKISLLTGRAHNKHTSGGDFREATLRALRQGLEKANSRILEPYYRFRIEVQLEQLGRVISDMEKLSSQCEPPVIEGDKVIIFGRGPVSKLMNYGMEFINISSGRGRINFIFDGYDLCHNEEEVIAKIKYDKKADIEYTSSSVFCSKGQSFIVDGSKAESYMHCLH
ncbi:tetracycline resistance protein [Clostridium zeae]|uniref:Tetracycline resistance protein n=1 Tax=Clostridium zeae TaxID=2759022 RepID=A0ABQ1E7D2_9CLOT|nr:TetM/TetW/TetO/TetS family tetracycline resistance ribosomal protection protein [Clostridium zeae]GFZ30691.1 tetracycline resistance protein [Clostridium zeae]